MARPTTISFRPDPGVSFPSPESYGAWWKFHDVLIGDEIVRGTFTHTDQPVWTLTDCQRGLGGDASRGRHGGHRAPEGV